MSDINAEPTSTDNSVDSPRAYEQPGHSDMGAELPDFMNVPNVSDDKDSPTKGDILNKYLGREEPEQAPVQQEPETQKDVSDTTQADVSPENEAPKGLFDNIIDKQANQVESELDSIKEPEGMTDSTLEGWGALKDKAKGFEKENLELKEKIAQYEGNPEQVSEYNQQIETLQKEKEDLLNKIAEKDLTAHPEFQSKYDQPLNDSKNKLEAIMEDSESDLKVSDLLKMKRKDLAEAVEEITDGMPKVYARDFVEEIAKAKDLEGQREDALGNASEFMTSMNEAQTNQAFESFNQTANQYKNEHGYLFNPLQAGEGATEEQKHEVGNYNNALAEIEKNAQSYAFGQMSNEEMSRVAIQASANDFMVKHAIPRLEKEYMSLLQNNQQMAQQLKDLQGIKPKVNTPASKNGDKPSFGSTKDVVNYYMGR
jgi:hypothetical protein